MPQVTAGTLNIVDSIIRASSNTANAVTASAGTVVTLMNSQIVTPAADNVARVSIAGYHSIISLVYDKANSTLSNSLNSVVYFQTANVDSLVSSGNVTGAYILGNGSELTNLPAPTVTQDITSNGAMSIMTYDGTIKYVNYATVEPSSGNIIGGNILTGGLISATGNITAANFIGNGSQLSSVATQVTGSWTLAAGTNTVSLTVPGPGTYSIWVNGNIPNGIVTYTATVVVTNTNVPVLGTSYGWYYLAGNALVLTAIPDQIVGSPNAISTAVVATTTANVFTFGITNNSGSNQVVNYGYTKL
jgi:hypothetical protein